jgi:hypothetical protein
MSPGNEVFRELLMSNKLAASSSGGDIFQRSNGSAGLLPGGMKIAFAF